MCNTSACCGKGVGLLGILVCVVAVADHFVAGLSVLGMEPANLFLGGVGLMVMAVLAKTCVCEKKE